jgi:hypothetical protein
MRCHRSSLDFKRNLELNLHKSEKKTCIILLFLKNKQNYICAKNKIIVLKGNGKDFFLPKHNVSTGIKKKYIFLNQQK